MRKMQSSYSIRPARLPADASRITDIVGAVWKGGGDALVEAQYGQIGNAPWQHYQSKAVLDWIQSPTAQAYVVVDTEREGEIVAFCSFQIDRDRDTATVGYNAFFPTHQGRGIGGLMMNYVMDRIRESGVGYAGVIVADNDEHIPARRVYEKAGFQTVYGLRYMFQKLS